jgi:seryl-tRNA synthetase
MIDRNLLINDFEKTAGRLARKGVDRQTLTELHDLLLSRRRLSRSVDDVRAEINKSSKEVGQLIRDNLKDQAEGRRAAVSKLKENLSQLEANLKDAQEKIEYQLLRIPNLPDDDAPEGKGEDDNKVVRVHQYDAGSYKGKEYKPHWEVAGALGIYDAERAAKISGAMFALLRGDGARLIRALVQFGLDLNRETYEEILPPHFVRTDTFTATGHLPKFEMDAYRLRDDDLWAIPTGEVPLMSIHRDEILSEEELPKRYVAYTVCFRREAGSAGKDTRGLQRLHEFHKVEMVRLCTAETAPSEFESLLADAERPLKLLGLPYRVVDLCAGDLTFSSARIFDLEVYSPGVDRWLEVSSVGSFTDFQTRRGNIRVRRSSGKLEFAHAMNGSALATPRLWAAIIEHGQQADGSVKLPEALAGYLDKNIIGPVASSTSSVGS